MHELQLHQDRQYLRYEGLMVLGAAIGVWWSQGLHLGSKGAFGVEGASGAVLGNTFQAVFQIFINSSNLFSNTLQSWLFRLFFRCLLAGSDTQILACQQLTPWQLTVSQPEHFTLFLVTIFPFIFQNPSVTLSSLAFGIWALLVLTPSYMH